MGNKILFVDDSASMRHVVAIALKGEGYEIVTAEDGLEAYSKLNERFNVIISDLKMPHMDGVEFIKHVKNSTTNQFTPIVVLTTVLSEEVKEQCHQLGAKVWMEKPFKPQALIDVLKKLLG